MVTVVMVVTAAVMMMHEPHSMRGTASLGDCNHDWVTMLGTVTLSLEIGVFILFFIPPPLDVTGTRWICQLLWTPP